MTPSQRRGDDRPVAYYKYGTIEKFMWSDDPDIRSLHPFSKVIAVCLLTRAITSHGFTCVVSESEVCAALNAIDPKTFRKHLRQLTDCGLVRTDRNRVGAMKRYDVSPIYERFGEQRIDSASKVTHLQTGSISRTADRQEVPKVGENFPARAGAHPVLDRENFPVSIKESTSSSTSGTSSHLSACARGLGIETTTGLEPREIVAAAEYLTYWAFPGTRQRELVAHFGVKSVAEAIGYVLQQQRLYPGEIAKPHRLFLHALQNRWSGAVPSLPCPSGEVTDGRHDATAS